MSAKLREFLEGGGKGPVVCAAAGVGLCCALGAGGYYCYLALQPKPRRPYVIKDIKEGDNIDDPKTELTNVINWVQDNLIRPIDCRLPGNPFEYDLWAFPFTPMVTVVGNHSAGKSTFINNLLGTDVQDTGVAPTNDGFSVLQRDHKPSEEDGRTLLDCPENKPFRELEHFGPHFYNELRRKRLVLPKESTFPFDLQIVDTPGMTDTPVKVAADETHGGGGTGYNITEVVRWFGKRSDLILVLFDPDKPGTSGVPLEVLTNALGGQDHKLLIVLNKVDRLDNSLDFARAYGNLGWSLAKVMLRKDLPMIYTMYNDTGAPHANHKLPLDTFREKRDEVINEVLSCKSRHWHNVITTTEDTLRQLVMMTTITSTVRSRVSRKRTELQLTGSISLLALGLIGGRLLVHYETSVTGIGLFGGMMAGACSVAALVLGEVGRRFESFQTANLNRYFEDAYKAKFIHSDGESLRARWLNVRPRIENILRSITTITDLPVIHSYEIDMVKNSIEEDVVYMRKLARLLAEASPVSNLKKK